MFIDESVYWVSEQSLVENAVGKFESRILVIVNNESGVEGKSLDFIEKVLTAAKIDLAKDTALLSIEKIEPIKLFPFPKSKIPLKVLVFGLEPNQLGLNINFQWYQHFVFSGITFLFAEKISLLETDRDRKMNLWNALKSIFLS
jgi:hypothetical protein